jgi:hypothetical protein
MAGGFEVDLSKLPAKPDGRTGVGGELVAPEMADADFEAHRLLFELQRELVSLSEDLHGKRHIMVDERARALMLRLADLRRYTQVLAEQQQKAFVCPRCQREETHDESGKSMCSLCVSVTYGRSRLR